MLGEECAEEEAQIHNKAPVHREVGTIFGYKDIETNLSGDSSKIVNIVLSCERDMLWVNDVFVINDNLMGC